MRKYKCRKCITCKGRAIRSVYVRTERLVSGRQGYFFAH